MQISFIGFALFWFEIDSVDTGVSSFAKYHVAVASAHVIAELN